MINPVSRFYNSIEKVKNLDDRFLVGLFVYYLTVEKGDQTATSKSIDECFTECDLTPPKRTAAYLSEGLANDKYVKAQVGYKLQRHFREELSKALGTEKVIVQTSSELRKLESKVNSPSTRDFLKETIDCFEVGANRATIIMCWILCLDHLQNFVMQNHLAAFNAILAKNTDRAVKATCISSRDDFGGTFLKESSFYF